ncbi:MAG TPA: hypothetical protein VFW65_10105 [Pseudonocardiaceae bacterium]|nr:hypothetical protein [Pseudonocardiaceae bacterium]
MTTPDDDPIAVSPAAGPVPPIYVPRSPAQARTAGQFWRSLLRTAFRRRRNR